MEILVLILVFTGIAFLEIPGLKRKKQWPELITFSVLLTLGFLLFFLQAVGISVPNPDKGVEYLIKLIFP